MTDGPWTKYATPTDGAAPTVDQPVGPWMKYAQSKPQSPPDAIDYNRPMDDVRADIAKLPAEHHDAAIRNFGEAQAEQDRKSGLGSLPMPRVPVVSAIGDQINAGIEGGVHALTGAGKTYEESLAYQRAMQRQQREQHPAMGLAGDLAGGAMLPMPTAAASGVGRVAQAIWYGAAVSGAEAAISTPGNIATKADAALTHGAIGAATGGVIGTAAEGVGAIATAAMRQGATGASARLAESLPGTVDEFANQVATGASTANQATQRRTLDILGKEMRNAGGDRAVALPAALARIQQEQGVTPATAATHIRNLTEVHSDSPLMLGEYPAVAQSDQALRGPAGGNRQAANVNLDELGRVQETPTQGIIDYLANAGNSRSATQVRNAISERQETLAPQMADQLQRLAPQTGQGRAARPLTIEDTTNMADAARQAGSVAYGIAHNAPMRMTPQQLQNELEAYVQHWAGQANQRSGAVGDARIGALREFFERDPMTGGVVRNQAGTPQVIDVTGPEGLRKLQDARGALSKTIRQAVRSGDENTVAALQPMYHDTRPNLITGQRNPDVTDIMTRASPQWAAANRHWANMNFEEMAADLGDAFAKRAGPQFREQLNQFNGMAPQAQDIVRVHFLQQIFDKLDNLGDTHSISKLFANDHNRNAIRALFGDEAAVSFTRAVRDQKAAELSQAATKNSRTHIRGQVQKNMDSDTGILAAAESANASGLKNWLMEKATQLLTERRNRPLADMVTTPMRDTAAVAQRIAEMRAAQARMAAAAQPSNNGIRSSMALAPPIANAISPPQKKRGMALTRPN